MPRSRIRNKRADLGEVIGCFDNGMIIMVACCLELQTKRFLDADQKRAAKGFCASLLVIITCGLIRFKNRIE
jgi:hypothetical protein